MPQKDIVLFHPREHKLKKTTIKVVFTILARAFSIVSKIDEHVKHEVAAWPKNLKVAFSVRGTELTLGLQKDSENKLTPADIKPDNADIHIMFKNVDSAFLMVTAQIGIPQAYSERRIIVRGKISLAMSLIRCLNVVQTYLFPKFIAKRVIRDLPHIPTIKRYIRRLRLYFLALPFGV